MEAKSRKIHEFLNQTKIDSCMQPVTQLQAACWFSVSDWLDNFFGAAQWLLVENILSPPLRTVLVSAFLYSPYILLTPYQVTKQLMLCFMR